MKKSKNVKEVINNYKIGDVDFTAASMSDFLLTISRMYKDYVIQRKIRSNRIVNRNILRLDANTIINPALYPFVFHILVKNYAAKIISDEKWSEIVEIAKTLLSGVDRTTPIPSFDRHDKSVAYWRYLHVSKNYTSDKNWEIIDEIITQIKVFDTEDKKIYNTHRLTYILYEAFANIEEHAVREKTTVVTDFGYCISKEYMYFAISDAGYTIPKSVSNKLLNFNNDTDAILWATKEFNTTKKDSNGGMGLPAILDHTEKMDGTCIIISRNGIIEFENGKPINVINNNYELNGTVVLIKIPIESLLEKGSSIERNYKLEGIYND